jgi:hypothetical protein
MTTKILKSKGICLMLVLTIVFSCILTPAQPVSAASNKIKIYNFIKLLVPAVDLK